MEIRLTKEISSRLLSQAEALGLEPEDYANRIIGSKTAPVGSTQNGGIKVGIKKLVKFVRRIPGITFVAHSDEFEPNWWIKFSLGISHPLAWRVVQELGFVLNYISVEDRLPVIFMPVSPPPYLNGGPKEFLAWVIECDYPFVNAEEIAKVMEQRLPNPIEDSSKWQLDDAK